MPPYLNDRKYGSHNSDDALSIHLLKTDKCIQLVSLRSLYATCISTSKIVTTSYLASCYVLVCIAQLKISVWSFIKWNFRKFKNIFKILMNSFFCYFFFRGWKFKLIILCYTHKTWLFLRQKIWSQLLLVKKKCFDDSLKIYFTWPTYLMF